MNLLSAGSFSAYLGYPRKAYFVPKKENTKETNFNCNSNSTPKKKSARKTKHDNLRAAKFQAKKVEESEQSAAAAVEASSPTAFGNFLLSHKKGPSCHATLTQIEERRLRSGRSSRPVSPFLS